MRTADGRSFLKEERRQASWERGTPSAQGKISEQFGILQDLSRAFGAIADADEAHEAVTRWIREALDDDEAGLRLIVVGADGRLSVRFADAKRRAPDPRPEATWRRTFDTRRPVREPLDADQELLVLPLVTRGTAVGVIEVMTRAGSIEERWPVVAAVTSQTAILLARLEQTARLRSEVGVAEAVADLARRLLRVKSRGAAVDAVVRFCADQLASPVGVWTQEQGVPTLALESIDGMTKGAERALRAGLSSLPAWSSQSEADRSDTLERFARAVGRPAASAISAGETQLLLVGTERSGPLTVVEELLLEAIGQIGYIDRARRGDDQIDMALAWAAHELRQPLVSVRANLENLRYEQEPADPEILTRLVGEVEALSDMLEPTLQHSVGRGGMALEPTDLMELVREAVASLGSQEHVNRVRVSGPARLVIAVDRRQILTALTNVFRNAIVYSPSDSTVDVEVREEEDGASIRTSDRGPGVLPTEWDRIFDPFIRGRAGSAYRGGKGLGLFIARRAVESHHGRIWVEPAPEGAVFTIRIPVPPRSMPGASQLELEPRGEGVPAGRSV